MINIIQLRWALSSLGLILALHAPYQATWIIVSAALLLAWRYWLAAKQKKLPGNLLLFPLVLLCAVGVLFTYGALAGRDASTALFTLLLMFKVMESKSQRDFTVVVLLGYFLTICTFLFSQSLLAAVLTIVPLLVLTCALVSLNQRSANFQNDALITLGGNLIAQALPVMLLLFVLFPRAPGPLWGVPKDATRGMTGLSGEMKPGSISDLSLSDAVAFRVTFQGEPPHSSRLYWRGPVLWDFNGQVWSATYTNPLTAANLVADSAPINYTVTLEPHNKPWLLVLDMPVNVGNIGVLTQDYQYQSRQPIRTRMRYEAASALRYHENTALDEQSRNRALRLPEFGNQQARELGASWANETPANVVLKGLSLFAKDFSYTLTPPPLGASSVDGFLFNTKKGFCEHYASSFVFLMRAAGVPARVVTGYQGGEINPVGEYMIIRQADAHAWAEVWLDGQGWVRVDPTSAVSPARIQSGIASALPASEPLPALVRPSPFKRLRLGWDSINNGWNQWVLGYNQQRQTEFLSKISGSKVTRGDMALWLSVLLIVIVGLIALWVLRPSRNTHDATQNAWLKFQAKLARAGLQRQPAEGPLDFAVRAAQAFPACQERIDNIVELYLPLRYGGGNNARQIAQLQRHVREFKAR
jgi:transglutaminase-like putative cysteine protease